jgi:hypothetical protein
MVYDCYLRKRRKKEGIFVAADEWTKVVKKGAKIGIKYSRILK